jgi:hypothetical protein
LNTPYGNLEPFFEMVDSAKDERETLLEKWKDNFLIAANTKRIWIS